MQKFSLMCGTLRRITSSLEIGFGYLCICQLFYDANSITWLRPRNQHPKCASWTFHNVRIMEKSVPLASKVRIMVELGYADVSKY